MPTTLEQPSVGLRAPAQPDPITHPLPRQERTGHAPWLTALAGTVAGALWVDPATLGLLGCGAGGLAVCSALTHRRFRAACQAAHLSGGMIVLAIVSGPAAAGAFAPAVGVLLTVLLAARAGAARARQAVAPLSGIVPWHFRRHYRTQTMRFGLAGMVASLALALLGPTTAIRIAAVAVLPLSMRAYVGNLISAQRARAVWALITPLHIVLLGMLVPGFGATAAAWSFVAAEVTLLFAAVLAVTRRTGVTPFRNQQVAILVATTLLVATITFPATRDWPFLLAVFGGVALGAVLFPRARSTGSAQAD